MTDTYRSADEAIRDGWWVSFCNRSPWWWRESWPTVRYSCTCKRYEYHVELAANSLAELRREIRRLNALPLGGPNDRLRFTRDYWTEKHQGYSH